MSDALHDSQPAAAGSPAGRGTRTGGVIPFTIVEEFYKRPGRTIFASIAGFDPFDFWFGRFYVGFFGITAILGIIVGVFGYLYEGIVNEGTYNILAMRIDPPLISAGLRLISPDEKGFWWMITVIAATIAFVSWALRQVDISRKLDMTYEIPLAFGAVVSSWITLQWLRPIAMGAWGNGFPLGITHHLDWVSNIGYQYYNFFYNPFHAIGITLLFASTLLLAMHGSAILSEARRPGVTDNNIDTFWRNVIGFGVGEIGVHRVAFWVGALSVLFANLCIFLSGPLVKNWSAFWSFWSKMPIWSQFGQFGLVLLGAVGMGIVFARRHRPPEPVDLEKAGAPGQGLDVEGNIGGQGYFSPLIRRLLGEGSGQVGPIYLGYWGVLSIISFSVTVFIILIEYLWKVGYNPILFLREFWTLSVDPPLKEFGLGFPGNIAAVNGQQLTMGWHTGGAWIFATFFLHLSVIFWTVRLWTRARATGLGTHLAVGYLAALSLYFVIYLIRPMWMGRWSEAPGHGQLAILNWTNYVSIQWGNFYYNPFHMISIFFLLGSTLLLAMHGATIVAASKYGAEREGNEMWAEGPGTQRAQLFWRWCMGWNANSLSIHIWLWWFAALCGITGAIGLLLSGPIIQDWFAWAEQVRIVAPWPNPDWAQFVFK